MGEGDAVDYLATTHVTHPSENHSWSQELKICWGQYEIICSIENGPYCIIFVYKECNTIFKQLWREKKVETLFVVAARGII